MIVVQEAAQGLSRTHHRGSLAFAWLPHVEAFVFGSQ
jgi:hypothetical protein